MEVNGLTAQLTVPLPCATKSSGNLRFPQEIDRPQMYGLAVIVVASFATLSRSGPAKSGREANQGKGMDIWNELIVEDCRLMGTIPMIDQSPWPSDENPFKHVGRNDPCARGSGKKYKNCCLQ